MHELGSWPGSYTIHDDNSHLRASTSGYRSTAHHFVAVESLWSAIFSQEASGILDGLVSHYPSSVRLKAMHVRE